MKKQIFKGLLVAAIAVVAFGACKKDENAAQKENTSPVNLKFTDAQLDESREFFAKTLAKACNDESVQEFLKLASLEKINDDYEVLYMYVKNDIVKDGKSFATILQEQANRDLQGSGNTAKPDFFNDYLGRIDPALTIFTYAPDGKKVSDWNNKTPKKVALSNDDDPVSKILGDFDAQGAKGQIDALKHPTEFLYVVRANERFRFTPRNGQTLSALKNRCSYISCDCPYDGDYFYVYPVDCPPEIGGGSWGNGYPNKQSVLLPTNYLGQRGGSLCPNGTADRDVKFTKEHCYQFKFKDVDALDALESWWQSSPEMYCIIENLSGSTSNVFVNLQKNFLPEHDRDDYFIGGHTVTQMVPTSTDGSNNLETIVWDKSQYGNLMRYTWMEGDGGPKFDFSAGITAAFSIGVLKLSATTTVTVKDLTGADDDEAGSSVVSYCDPANGAGKNYATGIVLFSVKHLD